jgi:hypothetical protein
MNLAAILSVPKTVNARPWRYLVKRWQSHGTFHSSEMEDAG